MKKESVDQFVMVNAGKFPEFAQMQLRQTLEKMSDDKEGILLSTSWKDPLTSFLLAFFLGGLGVDRFYLGDTGLGVLKLLTCGGAGLWAFIDLFTAHSRARKTNLNRLNTL